MCGFSLLFSPFTSHSTFHKNKPWWQITAVFTFCLLLFGLVPQPAEVFSSPATVVRPLRDVAEPLNLKVGVTYNFYTFPPPPAIYQNSVPSNFNSITPENLMKFENIHPCPPAWLIQQNSTVANWVSTHGLDRPPPFQCQIATAVADEWEWVFIDPILTWAADNDLGVRGHTFLWDLQNPGWLIAPEVTLTVDEKEQVMVEHIETAVSHFCAFDNIYAYDVVNEAVLSNGTLRPTPWSDIPNYIHTAFVTARETLDGCGQPNVKLYYNDYGIEYNQPDFFRNDYGMAWKRPMFRQRFPTFIKAEAVEKYLAGLLFRPTPTPIDGIGFQAHLTMSDGYLPHDTNAMIATMNRFTQNLGLEVAITEMDVGISSSSPIPLYDEQATQFGGAMQACLLAINCVGFTVWGTDDSSSWRGAAMHPLMFYNLNTQVFNPILGNCNIPPGPPSAMYCPKPAYNAVYQAFIVE